MNTLTDLGERIIKTERERDQYKRERDSLIKDVEKLRRKVDELESLALGRSKYIDVKNYEISQLEKVVEKLREEKAAIEMYLDAIKTYKPMYEKLSKKYNNLTEHIKDKANNNPSEHRYFRLVHFIDDLEGGTDD
ncbi:hypothetical protein V5G65_09495 [Mammaliicoccus sciuri]|uniref:hypothetical protein n=1 Tax=Mammaliicoccus sciuri TaxID=1296 RepID=UPI0037A3D151